MAGYPSLNQSTASEYIDFLPHVPSYNPSSILEPENEDDIEEFSEEEIVEQDVIDEPVVHVEEPVNTVEEPVVHVEESVVHVDEPVDTVEEPVDTVEEPVVHVEEPVDTVEEPVVHVEEPVDTVEETIIEKKSQFLEETSIIEKIINQNDFVIEPKKLFSLKELPTLGNSAIIPVTKTTWGPSINPKLIKTTDLASLKSLPGEHPTDAKPMRSKYIQETFTIEGASQAPISKEEYTKIVHSIKCKYNVSIESTASKTSRIVLVAGDRTNVSKSKRELLKKLEKPINEKFTIPTSCKSAIIGLGGRTIRELTEKYGIRIRISEKPVEDGFDYELNDNKTLVTIHGDSSSVSLAKKEIFAIIKEETKNAVFKVAVEDLEIIPYISISEIPKVKTVKVQFANKTNEIIISGLREESKVVLEETKEYLKKLFDSITTQKVKIPGKFQILINAENIRKQFNVNVKFPSSVEDEMVTFIGPKKKVTDAISYSRSSSKEFIVETLEISKSHGNNVEHAKKLVLYFEKYNSLKKITEQYEDIQFVLPKAAFLLKTDVVKVNIVAPSKKSTEMKAARKDLINFVNDIVPNNTMTISDLDYQLFNKEITKVLDESEKDANYVLLGDFDSSSNEVFLIAQSSDEDFKPSLEETERLLQKVNSSLDRIRSSQSSLATETFECDSQQQDSIFGDSSKTLQLIMDEIYEHEGVLQVKLHSPKENNIFIRGNERSVKTTKKALNEIFNNPSRSHSDNITIPADVLSRFIGVKGANVETIRTKFDIGINIPDSTTGSYSKGPVEVTLTGLKYNVGRAIVYINFETKRWSDIITKDFLAPAQYQRGLLGSQRSNLGRLQEKYNVRINLSREGNIISIRGPSRGVQKAYDELKALLDFEMTHNNKVIVNVPVEHIPRIIGKNGQTINDIRAEFAVEMDFIQDTNEEKIKGSTEVELEIIGSKDSIKEASAKVKSILFETNNFEIQELEINPKHFREIIGSNGQTLRDIINKAGGNHLNVNRPVNIPRTGSKEKVITVQGPKEFVSKVVSQLKQIVENSENVITKELDILPERQGALIGPVGTVRRQLESEFGITLQIPNRGNSNGKVKITGLPENIAKAENKILNEILKESFDFEIMVPSSVQEFVSARGAFIQSLRLNQSVNVRYGSNNKLATKISNRGLQIPVNKIRGTAEEKTKFMIEDSPANNELYNNEQISWRVDYDFIDFDELLGFKSIDEQNKISPEDKKKEMLEIAKKRIDDRIELASSANSAGYIWCADIKKFNNVIGPVGTRIGNIRDKTGCLINVPKKNDKVNDIIYIKGTKEAVEEAVNTIINILKH